MVNCEELFEIFKKNGFDFFTGVPDSTFKDWIKFLNDKNENGLTNVIAPNEGSAVAIAAGNNLATGKISVVYMQNAGLGNIVNPQTSLTDSEVYSIPILYLIGWRGEPGIKDEPQHKKMGKITLPLLQILGIPYQIIDKDSKHIESMIKEAKKYMESKNSAYALVIKKGTFDEYVSSSKPVQDYEMSREDAIKVIIDTLNGEELIVSTTGKTSRELFEYREERKESHEKDFLTVGSMGHSASIALGIATQKPERKIIIFDGDGAVIMHGGVLPTIGHYSLKNLYHIIFNNESYDSTGGQPTISTTIDFEKLALASNYKSAKTVKTKEELIQSMKELTNSEGPRLLVVKVKKGARKDLGRPTTTPIKNKQAFISFLNK